MATRKNQKAGNKSEQTIIDYKAETRAIEEWLRIVDKSLSREDKGASSLKISN